MEPRGGAAQSEGQNIWQSQRMAQLGVARSFFGRTSVWDVVGRKAPQELGALLLISFSSWVWLSAPGPLRSPSVRFWNLPIHLNLSAPLLV